MYVKGNIFDVEVEFLVDTGSNVTLISPKVWKLVQSGRELELEAHERVVVNADGSPLQVMGKTEIGIKFGDEIVTCSVIVAGIALPAILGLDFLSRNDGRLNFGKGASLILGRNGVRIPVEEEFKTSSYRVALIKNIVVPAGLEAVAEGVVVGSPYCKKDLGSMGIVEPRAEFMEKKDILVGPTLVDPSRQILPVRIANLTSVSQTLYKGTHVGTISPVDGIVEEQGGPTEATNIGLHPDMSELFDRSSEGLTEGEKGVLFELLGEFRNVFCCEGEPLGKTGVVKHVIDTGNAHPVRQAPRRLPYHHKLQAQIEVENMLEQGVISPSKSAWASPVVLVRKKDGTIRFCVDYCKLNDLTIKDAFPLPRIDDSLDTLSGAKWFSVFDLRSGYWQVEVDPADKNKAAFTSGTGLYEFSVMAFGLCNAPSTFQRLMEQVLSGLHWRTCLIYIDDIIIYARTFDEHIVRLREVIGRLRDAGLKLKPSKCELFRKKVKYLGHVVSEKGVEADPEKVESVVKWPTPRSVKDVRRFIGFCSYYRKFIQDFAYIASPLHMLTRKGERFTWTDECQEAFQRLKLELTKAPVLAYPNFHETFILDTDASSAGVGAVLSQVIDGKERPVAYASRTLSRAESKYSVTRKELLAVVTFIKHFRPYLCGKRFTLRTDHGSLRWLFNFKQPEGQIARWLEVLASYDFDIVHRPGRKHVNADSLSRDPTGETETVPNAEVPQTVRQVVDNSGGENWMPGCTKEQLRDYQLNDADIGPILRWKEESAIRPSLQEVSGLSAAVKAYWFQWDQLRVMGGILCRFWASDDRSQDRFLLVVPKTLRNDIL
ncbi:hypothetical protein HOLleu_30140 [Holothuria leucospilota]|uniref:Reverse transcriptase n=1 Tax=Holothuria leucospilota TaxID=206669 RepID=A0A9Q1GYD3_HOLLE|nr:hypothetical protein HOLleu_30140 [Holothuria leucospilota]